MRFLPQRGSAERALLAHDSDANTPLGPPERMAWSRRGYPSSRGDLASGVAPSRQPGRYRRQFGSLPDARLLMRPVVNEYW